MEAKEKPLDIKTRIEAEPILAVGNAGKNRINALHDKGIKTIEDFINLDVRVLSPMEEARRKYRIFQDVIRSKYLDVPLLRSAFLESSFQYGKSNEESAMVGIYLTELGFYSMSIRKQVFRNLNAEPMLRKKQTKIIDIIKHYFPQGDHSYRPLMDYYISYYDKHLSMEEARINPERFLKNARKELATLVNERDSLDEKIAAVQEQIDSITKGGATHEL